MRKYYDSIHDGLASLLRSSLKDNVYLQYAMITGIQRVAKENIFSDLNNLLVCTVVRSDLVLKAKRSNLPSYVVEMHFCAHEAKYTKEVKKLKSLLSKGEKQINKTKYGFDLTNEVIHIAHSKKDVMIEWIEQ